MSLADDTLESEILELRNAELDEPDFIEQLAELMDSACDASGHWVLLVDNQVTEVLSEDNLDLADFQALAARHHSFYATRDLAIAQQRTTTLPLTPKLPLVSEDSDDFDSLLHTEGHVFFVPIRSQMEVDLMICLYCESFPDTDVTALSQQLTLLSMLSDARANFAQSQAAEEAAAAKEQETLQANAQLKKALDLGNAASMHLDKKKTAFVLASELQNFLDIDRVTVIEQVGNQSRLLAVSGQASINKRANIVRCIQRLAKVVLKSGESLWFDGDQEELAGPVAQVVEQYLNESLVQSFALIPIYEGEPPVYRSDEQSLIELVSPGRTEKKKLRGAILLESIQQPLEREIIQPQWEQVEIQVASHFNNAKRHSDLFFLPVLSVLTKFAALFRGHTQRIAWGLSLGIIALLAAGFLIPADFRVRCEGYLQPEKMHHVFVNEEGIVTEVLVKEGQAVEQGDALVRLQNRDLELELAGLAGELNEKQQLQKQLTYKRLDYMNNRATQNSGQTYNDLAEEMGLLAARIRSLEKSLTLKQKQREDLIIRAPFSGQVMGWNVDRKFLNRPLDQGTRLFSVAQINERRVLELKVPDQRSGYITTAWQEALPQDVALHVEFSIASFPDQRFNAQVTHINPGLEQDTDLGYVLPVEARPNSELPADLRVGVPVVAKVICGQKSFIYCKTYEFVDWVNRTTFEYFF